MPSSLLPPPLRPQGPAPRSPHKGCLHSSGSQDPLPTPGARRNLTARSPGGRQLGIPLYKWDRDEVGTPPRGGLRAIPRAAPRCGLSPGGRAGGREAPGRAEPGARSLPRSAGRWRWGQWLPRREAVARAGGGGGGPAGAARGLRADASPAICGRRGGGGDSTGDSSARRGPEQSNSGGRRAQAPHHRGPRAERLRARPRPGEGREPQRRGAPGGGGAPPGPGGPRGDTRQRRSRARSWRRWNRQGLGGSPAPASEAGPLGGSRTLQRLPQPRRLQIPPLQARAQPGARARPDPGPRGRRPRDSGL